MTEEKCTKGERRDRGGARRYMYGTEKKEKYLIDDLALHELFPRDGRGPILEPHLPYRGSNHRPSAVAQFGKSGGAV